MSRSVNLALSLTLLSIRRTVRGRIFYYLLGATALLILGSVEFARFGPEFRMVQEMAVSTTLLGATMIALIAGTATIRAERDDETVSIVLSKPVPAVALLVYGYMGTAILLALYVAFSLALGLLATHLKAGQFDPEPAWGFSHIATAFLLVFLNAAITAAISSALSPVCKRITNLFLTLAILGLLYMLAPIAPSVQEFPLIPSLSSLDGILAISHKAQITPTYIALSILYSALLCGATLLLGAWRFSLQEPSRA